MWPEVLFWRASDTRRLVCKFRRRNYMAPKRFVGRNNDGEHDWCQVKRSITTGSTS